MICSWPSHCSIVDAFFPLQIWFHRLYLLYLEWRLRCKNCSRSNGNVGKICPVIKQIAFIEFCNTQNSTRTSNYINPGYVIWEEVQWNNLMQKISIYSKMTLLSIQFKNHDKVLSIVKICFKPTKVILVHFLYDWLFDLIIIPTIYVFEELCRWCISIYWHILIWNITSYKIYSLIFFVFCFVLQRCKMKVVLGTQKL